MPQPTILIGDALTRLRELPDESVQCCVTSPPYFGLRDYGTASWEGGDPECDHKQGRPEAGRADGKVDDRAQRNRDGVGSMGGDCKKCGARRIDSQIGLESTPQEFVANLVKVFEEVRRVLKRDGVMFLNLGDSYASSPRGNKQPGGGNLTNSNIGSPVEDARFKGGKALDKSKLPGLKPKDLIGIPWRVAFALQEAGWYLRQDIIWCLSGGTWLYVRTQKGEMPMTVKDVSRLDPATVQLWNGQKWTRLLGTSKSHRKGDEVELVLRSGERISCTPTHRFPTGRGLLEAKDIRVGDKLEACQLPEPEQPRDCALDTDAAWLAGLYVAEGSRSEDTIQISGHSKEKERWEKVQRIAAKFGGCATRTVDGNKQDIRLYGKVLNAVIDELVAGRTAKNKGFAPVVWRYSNEFIASLLDGYLSGDGHNDTKNGRWRLGFCRNYNLERDLRTACARLGYAITLNMTSAEYDGRQVPTFRGEIRKKRSGHHNEKDRNEVVEIRKARCRSVYDLGVEDEPHLFALASGVLTHNSKPNPMPESVTDRCTKAHEYLFLLTKSAKYYYDYEAVKEDGVIPAGTKGAKGSAERAAQKGVNSRPPEYKVYDGKRNKRSVWTVTTRPYKGAHFATFPPELIRPCILAGSAKGDTVLDPFAGSGTTGQVASEEGRESILIELNPEYEPLIRQRTAPKVGKFLI